MGMGSRAISRRNFTLREFEGVLALWEARIIAILNTYLNTSALSAGLKALCPKPVAAWQGAFSEFGRLLVYNHYNSWLIIIYFCDTSLGCGYRMAEEGSQ